MKVLTPLMGYLGKATGARSNTPEVEDTKPTMPGLINLTLAPPFPIFTTLATPQPALDPPLTNSFIFSEAQTFITTAGSVLLRVGPGVWRIHVNHWCEEQGAVSDPTGKNSLLYGDALSAIVNPILSTITNKQGVAQFFSYDFFLTALTEQGTQFVRSNTAGLGTGANISHICIIAQRLF